MRRLRLRRQFPLVVVNDLKVHHYLGVELVDLVRRPVEALGEAEISQRPSGYRIVYRSIAPTDVEVGEGFPKFASSF